MTSAAKPLGRRIMGHWAWGIVFCFYFAGMALWQDSAILGIISGMYIALIIYHYNALWHERKDNA